MLLPSLITGTESDSLKRLGREAVDSQNTMALAVPKEMNMLQQFRSPMPLTATDVIDRIMEKRETYLARYQKKAKAEQEYYDTSTYTQEL